MKRLDPFFTFSWTLARLGLWHWIGQRTISIYGPISYTNTDYKHPPRNLDAWLEMKE